VSHNLARLAEEALERQGDGRAVCFEGRWHSAEELFERGTRLAGGVAQLGVEPGDRVVVLMENCPEVGIVYHAVWRAGAVVTPAVFLLTREELRRMLLDAEPRLVLTTPAFLDTVEAGAAGLDVQVISTLAELEQAEPAPIVPRADSDLAALVYTGGTTGHAKGVMLSHENLWLSGKAAHDVGHVAGITRSLTALPLSHSYGLLVLAVGLHALERTRAVLMRWFEPSAWLELAQEHAVQIAAVVPSMIHLLLAQRLEDYDLSALRFIASGAAPLPAEAAQELRRRVPGVELREGYGLTETAALVSSNPPGRVRPGSVGPPVAGTEVRVVDEADRELPPGEVGEICCHSGTVMLGYWRAPELSDEVLRGGWLHTGDLGRLDEDGYLYVVDRKKDLIIRGGFNVFPRDVEEALLEHPAVAGACVVGRPDEVHGEEIVAFVSLVSGSETPGDDLIAFCKQRIGGYRYPREVQVLPALPLTPVGKVDRKALRAMLAVEGGRR